MTCLNSRYNNARMPRVIALPATPKQLAAVVKCAGHVKLPFVVRNGGHSYAGMSRVGEGLILDLTRFDSMRLSATKPGSRGRGVSGGRLFVGAGQRLGPIYALLVKEGLMLAGGCCPSVGISGITLAGGKGLAHRHSGLLADAVRSAVIVTGDGRVLKASDESHSDLLWAIKVGCGNSGSER